METSTIRNDYKTVLGSKVPCSGDLIEKSVGDLVS
jgi:hypothetical protein